MQSTNSTEHLLRKKYDEETGAEDVSISLPAEKQAPSSLNLIWQKNSSIVTCHYCHERVRTTVS